MNERINELNKSKFKSEETFKKLVSNIIPKFKTKIYQNYYYYGYIDFFIRELQFGIEIDGPSHRTSIYPSLDLHKNTVWKFMGLKIIRLNTTHEKKWQELLDNFCKKHYQCDFANLLARDRLL